MSSYVRARPYPAGQVDLAAAEALYVTVQLCLGVSVAHGRDKDAHAELATDEGLVSWALRNWDTREVGEKVALSTTL